MKQWAPLIWLSPNEQYFPLSVDTFLENVHLQSESGVQAGALQDNDFLKIDAQSLFLVANKKFGNLSSENNNIHCFEDNFASQQILPKRVICLLYTAKILKKIQCQCML